MKHTENEIKDAVLTVWHYARAAYSVMYDVCLSICHKLVLY